jgi:hypothetical protein
LVDEDEELEQEIVFASEGARDFEFEFLHFFDLVELHSKAFDESDVGDELVERVVVAVVDAHAVFSVEEVAFFADEVVAEKLDGVDDEADDAELEVVVEEVVQEEEELADLLYEVQGFEDVVLLERGLAAFDSFQHLARFEDVEELDVLLGDVLEHDVFVLEQRVADEEVREDLHEFAEEELEKEEQQVFRHGRLQQIVVLRLGYRVDDVRVVNRENHSAGLVDYSLHLCVNVVAPVFQGKLYRTLHDFFRCVVLQVLLFQFFDFFAFF